MAEGWFRALVEGLPVGVVVLIASPEGQEDLRISSLNDVAVGLLGAGNASDLLGRRFLDVMPVRAQAGLAERLNGLLQDGRLPPHVVMGVGRAGPEAGASRALAIEGGWLTRDDGTGLGLVISDVTHLIEVERALRRSEERLRAFFAQGPIGMAEVDSSWRLLSANQALADMLGYTVEELLALPAQSVVHPECPDGWTQIMRTVIETGHWTGVRVWRHRNGWPLPVLNALSLVRDVNGAPRRVACILVDLRSELGLRESEQQLRLAFDGSLVGMAVLSLRPGNTGRLLRINRALCDFLGYGEPELLQMAFEELIHPEDRKKNLAAMRDMTLGELASWRSETRLRHADGHYRWGLLLSAVIRDSEGRPVQAVNQVEDITARKEAEARLTHQVLHDSLTGLANRLLLHDHLSLALSRAKRAGTRVGVFFLDLDNFKTVNDSLGHSAGDELLLQVGRRLSAALRGGDVAARLGGDEFVMVCEDLTGPESVPAVAERLLSGLEEEIRFHGQVMLVSASMGVAVSGPGSHAEDLLRDADAAMYRAKTRGKARWEIADEDLQAMAARVLEVESGLRTALACGELEVYYQPVIQLDNDRVTGLEALLRWRHPQRGLLLPKEFLDVAEDRLLIVPIGAWVLQQACMRAAAWQRQLGDRAPTVAVNISARQLSSRGLAEQVQAAVESNGLAPGLLSLEITERQVIDLDRSAMTELRELAKLGIQLAVDDFGTGYAGFEYLRRLPVSVLKIDRSYTDGLGHDRTDTAITRGIITIGQSLGLEVIAEGVETIDQLTSLRELGCLLGQGWLWEPARPAHEIDALLNPRAAD
jgi:diguanylate cyclase (GGDEF)-like protein/PAS domain S-box-containing protein